MDYFQPERKRDEFQHTHTHKTFSGLGAVALALMLAFGAFFMSSESTDAASCWGRVANASYGNSSGYVYVRADTGCDTSASLYITAMISNYGTQTNSNSNSGYGTWLDVEASNPYICGSAAVGYSHNSGGGSGYGWTVGLPSGGC